MAAGAENVLFEVVDAAVESPTAISWVVDDGLPPPTQSQVEYWRKLCGGLTTAGARGLTAGQWSSELEPTRPTLHALVERGLIVRRKRAWHLKRDWYTRLSSLRQRAVPTPRETLATRPRPDLPSYLELESIEGICRWLDAQPKRRARLPFVGLVEAGVGVRSETPTPLLHLMHKHRLVHHTSVCEWALSPAWKERLLALWRGADREVREVRPPKPEGAEPFVVAAGIDTWYLNRIDPSGLPLALRHELDELQQQAAEDEEEIDTRWAYDGTPLRMYRAGVRAGQGGGVSWSYILRNNSLALLIRRAPLGGIVAQARLGSECLWRLTPLRALDELDALVKRMWFRPLPFKRRDGMVDDSARWQVSQIHLAVDVANAPLDLEQADRFVSRSRTQAVYQAAKSEVEQLMRTIAGDEDEGPEALTMDWEALYDDDAYDTFDPFDDLVSERERDVEPTPVEERAVTIDRFGKRVSGMTFSPGGDISMVLYDKVLQGRLRGKRHMEPIWQAAGWQLGISVTRNEARLRRKAVRELGLVGEVRACLDDPWECLTHLSAIFAAVVGHAEDCPDAVDVAWVRRVIPQEDDSNRSRWPTDSDVEGRAIGDVRRRARRGAPTHPPQGTGR